MRHDREPNPVLNGLSVKVVTLPNGLSVEVVSLQNGLSVEVDMLCTRSTRGTTHQALRVPS